MKKTILFLAAAVLAVSCNKLAENEYEITGTIDPSYDGKTVILEKQGMMGFAPVDTVKVEGDKFVFKGTTTDTEMVYVNIEGKANEKINFVLEPGSIDIEVDKDTLYKSVTGGTFNNEKLEEFKKISYNMYKKNQQYEKTNLTKYNDALKANDTVVLNGLKKDKEVIFKEWEKELVDFVKENPKAYCNVMVLGQVAQMQLTKMEDIRKLFDGLDPVVKNTKEGKKIAEYFAKMDAEKGAPPAPDAAQPEAGTGVKVGDAAPGFSAPAPDGKAVSLQQSMGSKVTIIDFWASWCKPCRAENPNVVSMYNELHSKGLNIVGVSLDRDAAKWKEAIAADKLTWAHVSNLKFWDEPIAKQYGVTSIPATFVVDASGKVVAKDLRGPELKAKVQELLSK